jgi:hypothetical protein
VRDRGGRELTDRLSMAAHVSEEERQGVGQTSGRWRWLSG